MGFAMNEALLLGYFDTQAAARSGIAAHKATGSNIFDATTGTLACPVGNARAIAIDTVSGKGLHC
jgi:hypothetical protein